MAIYYKTTFSAALSGALRIRPTAHAILLIGGRKTGDHRWYETYVPLADRIYDEYIETLKKEGLIDG